MPMTMIAPERRSRNLFDLIVTLDDATSEIYPAFLVEEEGTFPSFRGLAEVIARHGARGAAPLQGGFSHPPWNAPSRPLNPSRHGL